MQSTIHSQIRKQIDLASRNAIVVNPEFLDDEQLSREGQFAVLTEIFNTNVRNAEIREVCNHFSPIFQGGHPVHLSVLGKTGTGKTITMLYLLHEFEQLCSERGIPFRQYHLDLCCPAPCFRALNNLACLMGASKYYKRGISLDDLMTAMEEHLKDVPGYVTVFIDEADNVRTDADSFFKFLVKRLPQRIQAKLILLFASNRLNWADGLDPRVKSCLKMRELIFEPYNAGNLKHILDIRVEKALRPDMIQEGVVAKISAYSSRTHGDARKAVDLLIRSAYLAERAGNPITLDTVDQAHDEIERDKYVTMVRNSPKQLQAALFVAMCPIGAAPRGRPKGFYTGDAYLAYERFCAAASLPALTQRAFTDLLSELDMYGFIRARTVSRGRYGRSKHIHVSMPPAIISEIKRIILRNFDLTSEVMNA